MVKGDKMTDSERLARLSDLLTVPKGSVFYSPDHDRRRRLKVALDIIQNADDAAFAAEQKYVSRRRREAASHG